MWSTIWGHMVAKFSHVLRACALALHITNPGSASAWGWGYKGIRNTILHDIQWWSLALCLGGGYYSIVKEQWHSQRECSGGWSTPLWPGHKAYITTNSHLPWQRHRLYTSMHACKQKLKFKVWTLGVWSRFGACANLTNCSCPQVETANSRMISNLQAQGSLIWIHAAIINRRRYDLNISMVWTY